MATPDTDSSNLAAMAPLDAGPRPLSVGYNNPLTAIAGEFFKLHAEDNRRQANRELDRRDQLANDFDKFSQDPRYARYPDLQQQAHMHAVAIRQTPYNKKLPKHYEPDEKFSGLAPAYAGLFHGYAQREMARTGEPPQPAEPSEPPAPASPFGSGGPRNAAASAAASAATIGTEPPTPTPALGPAPVPGGIHVGPNQITPAPGGQAIGAPPPSPTPTPDNSPAPNYFGTDSSVLPATPAEQTSMANSIPASAAPELASSLGIDPDQPGAMIDLRALQRGSTLLKGAADRKVKLARFGMEEDENGNLVRMANPPVEVQYKQAMMDAAEARAELLKAQAISNPIERAAKIQHWVAMEAIARQNAATAEGRLKVGQGTLEMNRTLYGMGSSSTVPSGSGAGDTGGSGGPSDYVNDNHVKQTKSGRFYADLTSQSGKVKEGLSEKYANQGLPVVTPKEHEALTEIDGARYNLESIESNLISRLPKDATGRITGGLSNTLSQFLQTDEYLAASGAWRTSAIKAMRAAAGAQGLRINQAEITLAVNNDIPKITDTVATALQKIANIRAQLDNSESAILVPRRAGTRGSTGKNDYSSAAITQPPPAPTPTPANNPPNPPTNPDETFIARAMKIKNPATNKPYTREEAQTALNDRKKKKAGGQ